MDRSGQGRHRGAESAQQEAPLSSEARSPPPRAEARSPAREAERVGLVNAVLPAAEFEAGSAAWIGRLLALSGPALRLAKQAVSDARNLPPREARAILNRTYRDELMTTADADEGLRSFLEKRKPVWSHR